MCTHGKRKGRAKGVKTKDHPISKKSYKPIFLYIIYLFIMYQFMHYLSYLSVYLIYLSYLTYLPTTTYLFITYASWCRYGSQRTFCRNWFSLFTLSPEDQAQVVRLGGRELFPRSHLPGPKPIFEITYFIGVCLQSQNLRVTDMRITVEFRTRRGKGGSVCTHGMYPPHRFIRLSGRVFTKHTRGPAPNFQKARKEKQKPKDPVPI